MNCPQCNNPIDQDFGVVQCGKCSTMLVIDLDGNVQISGAPSVGAQSFSVERPLEEVPVDASEEDAPYEEMEFGSVIAEVAELEEAPAPSEDEAFAAKIEEPIARQEEPLAPSADEVEMAEGAESEEEVEEELVDIVEEAPAEPLTPLEEIAAFGNADLNTPLSYTLVIEGIDGKEVRESLREALREPKFNWNVAEMMSRVRNGRLELKKLDPVKASILVRKLQDLPIKVSWRQHAFEN